MHWEKDLSYLGMSIGIADISQLLMQLSVA